MKNIIKEHSLRTHDKRNSQEQSERNDSSLYFLLNFSAQSITARTSLIQFGNFEFAHTHTHSHNCTSRLRNSPYIFLSPPYFKKQKKNPTLTHPSAFSPRNVDETIFELILNNPRAFLRLFESRKYIRYYLFI